VVGRALDGFDVLVHEPQRAQAVGPGDRRQVGIAALERQALVELALVAEELAAGAVEAVRLVSPAQVPTAGVVAVTVSALDVDDLDAQWSGQLAQRGPLQRVADGVDPVRDGRRVEPLAPLLSWQAVHGAGHLIEGWGDTRPGGVAPASSTDPGRSAPRTAWFSYCPSSS
jgi:hypothetical protein